jgi:hypothetical protein
MVANIQNALDDVLIVACWWWLHVPRVGRTPSAPKITRIALYLYIHICHIQKRGCRHWHLLPSNTVRRFRFMHSFILCCWPWLILLPLVHLLAPSRTMPTANNKRSQNDSKPASAAEMTMLSPYAQRTNEGTSYKRRVVMEIITRFSCTSIKTFSNAFLEN